MKKKIAKSKPKKQIKKSVGRPAVEIKKKPFQIMLDPRYIEHFRKSAEANNLQPQELARFALISVVSDPYNPWSGKQPESLKNLVKIKLK